MRLRAVVMFTVGLVAVGAIVAPANAISPQNQLDLSGRSFAVTVSYVDDAGVQHVFPNCYRFDANGDWFDKVLNVVLGNPDPPALGTWVQSLNGKDAPYSAVADLSRFGFGKVYQDGTVAQAENGVLQLTATTIAPKGLLGKGKKTLSAVGSEVPSC